MTRYGYSPVRTGGVSTGEGSYFPVDSARVWNVPEDGVPLGVAVSGQRSIERFSPLAEHLITTEPESELLQARD